MKRWMQRVLVVTMAGGLFVCLSRPAPAAAADRYPTRPVKLLVPFAPGAIVDVAARIMSESLAKQLGVSVVVDYKGGSGGMIGADAVAKGAPDGYTILTGTIGPMVFGPITTPKETPYDVLKDFAPIAYMGESPTVIFVNAKSPVKTLEDLIAEAKKRPGKMNAGTIGVGSAAHFMLELINGSAGIHINHVPFKGGPGPVVTAVLGEHLDMGFLGSAVAMSHFKAGTLRPLAITSRLAALPGIPTLAEKGFGSATVSVWAGFLVASKTPKHIQDTLVTAFERVVKDPEVVARLEAAGYAVEYKGPAEFTKIMSEQLSTLGKAAEKVGIVNK